MKLSISIFSLIFTPFFLFAQSDLTYQEEAEALLMKTTEESKSVGMAAGFSKDGMLKWADGKGLSDKEKKTLFTSTTITRIASISKPMTATAILQLWEQGKIDLNVSIQTYLPDFPKSEKGDITVKHLLQQSSGIGAYKSKKEINNTVDYPNLESATKLFRDRPLEFAPGTAFGYTSYGYTVLGLIVERVSGQTFGEYLQENIFQKAEMTQTSIEDCHTTYEGKSAIYHRNSKGKVKERKMTNLSDRIPGGGVQSTVEDILKFGDALIAGKLIKPATFAMMAVDMGLKKQGNGYGMGFYLYGKNPKYGNVIGHSGAQLGCSGMLMLLPEVQTSIIVLSNTSGTLQEVSNLAVALFDLAAKS